MPLYLSPYTGPRKPIHFITYDLEWYPGTYRLRLAGLYDGASYESYDNMSDFCDALFSRRFNGVSAFAHAGGLADIHFILAEIAQCARHEYRVSAGFSGSSAVVVSVRRGNKRWKLCDSLFLLRGSLRHIAASIGLEKGGMDYHCPESNCGHSAGECIYYAPVAILRDYNELDCSILYRAIERLQDEILSLGGSLRPTIASTALRLFRSSYLREHIRIIPAVNAIAREAYVASRVEPFIRHGGPGLKGWDINSSFPKSMTSPQPGRYVGRERVWTGEATSIVRAVVTVPFMDVPPLPYRGKHGLFFPVGTWEGWYSGTDLHLLEEAGGRIERVKSALRFLPFSDLRGYVETIYAMRRTEKDEFRRLLLKLLLNALYGKFAQREEREALLMRPDKRPESGVEILPNVWIVSKHVPAAHAHVPISMSITAMSRALLTRAMWEVGDPHYCDTDSIFTMRDLPESNELGGWKLEKRVSESAVFLRPKLYRIDNKIVAKGFPRLNRREFDSIVNGGKVSVKRMARVREALRHGIIGPGDIEIEKGLRGKYTEKRYFNGNVSRPWEVGEVK